MSKVICNSGLTGWQDRLQNVYSDEEEFIHFSETYNIHGRLGFKTPEEAWSQNPIIQASIEPSDLRTIL